MRSLVVALIPAVLVVVATTFVPVPFVAMTPGPTTNVYSTITVEDTQREHDESFSTSSIAENEACRVSGEATTTEKASDEPVDKDLGSETNEIPVVKINGVDSFETPGELHMTTVSVYDRLGLGEALRFWWDNKSQLVPRDRVFPPGKPKEQVSEENHLDLIGSSDSAIAAAMDYLGKDLVVEVGAIIAGSAAECMLQPGDQLTEIRGQQIKDTSDVREAMDGATKGQQIAIEFVRGGRTMEQTVTLGGDESDPDSDRGLLGIFMAQQPPAPLGIDINVDGNVGGPSAGLIFSLAIVDKLSKEEIVGDRKVAGTGVITVDGEVKPIGGIHQKMLAARDAGFDAFLIPQGNCEEALAEPVENLNLIKVDSLRTAVEALGEEKDSPKIPRC